jgi:hypothetical protein
MSPAKWDWPHCGCTWNRYAADCFRPYHQTLALRDIPDPRLPLIMSAPAPDFIPQWMTEAAT